MPNSNFTYLEQEFPLLFNIGQSAEYYLHSDSIVCIAKLRSWGEKLTETLFHKHNLEFPRENTFHNRLKNLDLEGILPDQVKDLLYLIKNKGNIAVHENKGSVDDAQSLLLATFKISNWFYATYSSKGNDFKEINFSLPENLDTRHALNQLEKEHKQLELKFNSLLLERKTEGIAAEESQKIKQRSIRAASKINLSEVETRELIDEQLKQAGWEADTQNINYKKHKTLPTGI
jgi:type I restriction enzyme R subunit